MVGLTLEQQLDALALPLTRKRLIPLPFVGADYAISSHEAADRLAAGDQKLLVEVDGEKRALPSAQAVHLLSALAGQPHETLGSEVLLFHQLASAGCLFHREESTLSPYQAFLEWNTNQSKVTFHGLHLSNPYVAVGSLELLRSEEPAQRLLGLAELLEQDSPGRGGARLTGYTPENSPLGEGHDPRVAAQVAAAIKEGGLSATTILARPMEGTNFEQRLEAARALKTVNRPQRALEMLKAALPYHASPGEAVAELKALGDCCPEGADVLYKEQLAGHPEHLQVLAKIRASGFHSEPAVAAAKRLLDPLADLALDQRVQAYTDIGLLNGKAPLNDYSVKKTFYDAFRGMVLRGVPGQQAVALFKRLGQDMITRERGPDEANTAAWNLAALAYQPDCAEFFLSLVHHGYHATQALNFARLLALPAGDTTHAERVEAFTEAGLLGSKEPFNGYEGLEARATILLELLAAGRPKSECLEVVNSLGQALEKRPQNEINLALKAAARYPEAAGFVADLVKHGGFHSDRLDGFVSLVATPRAGLTSAQGVQAFKKLGLVSAPDEARRQYATKESLFKLFLAELGNDGVEPAVARALARQEHPKCPRLGTPARQAALERLTRAGYTPAQAAPAMAGLHGEADPRQAAEALVTLTIPFEKIEETAARVSDLLAAGHTAQQVTQLGCEALAGAGPSPQPGVVERVRKLAKEKAATALDFLREPLFLNQTTQRQDFFLAMLANGYTLEKAMEYTRAVRGPHSQSVIELFEQTGLLAGKEPLNQYAVKEQALKALSALLAAGHSNASVKSLIQGLCTREKPDDQIKVLAWVTAQASHPVEGLECYQKLLASGFHVDPAGEQILQAEAALSRLPAERRYQSLTDIGLVKSGDPVNKYKVKTALVELLAAGLRRGLDYETATRRVRSVGQALVAGKLDPDKALEWADKEWLASDTAGPRLEQTLAAGLPAEAARWAVRSGLPLEGVVENLEDKTNHWTVEVALRQPASELGLFARLLDAGGAAQAESRLLELRRLPGFDPQQWLAASVDPSDYAAVAGLVKTGAPFEQTVDRVRQQRQWATDQKVSPELMVAALADLKPDQDGRFRALVEGGFSARLAAEMVQAKPGTLKLLESRLRATVMGSPQAREQAVTTVESLTRLGQNEDQIGRLLDATIEAVENRQGNPEAMASALKEAAAMFALGRSDAAKTMAVEDEAIIIGDISVARQD
ncbi:MAG: hypothetical protein AB7J86_38245 [Vulcanimicrobiota bacterium]